MADDSAPPKGARGTIFRLGASTPQAVEQYEYSDGAAALQAWVSRFPGPRYSRFEAESLGKEMGATLLRVRDSCGGAGVSGAAPYKVKRSI